MKDIVRDSTLGALLNRASNGRLLPYEDQRQNYVLPARYSQSKSPRHNSREFSAPRKPMRRRQSYEEDDARTLVATTSSPDRSSASSPRRGEKCGTDTDKEAGMDQKDDAYPYLVDWEENDSDRPKNWSLNKRLFVAFLISFLTFAVYLGAAIYTVAIEDIMNTFGVAQVVGELGLSLFVLAYGIGPMIFSPLQELPKWGRLPIYVAGLLLFVIFQIPIVFAKNIGTILVFRFLAGLVGGPALATGGASMMDLFDEKTSAIAIGVWALGAVLGPIFGPVCGGFAAQANGYRWPIYELIWISGTALIMIVLFLPETHEQTILVRRAERLRKLTGNAELKCQAELDASSEDTPLHLVGQNIKRAIRLSMEPAVLFSNCYMALAYAIFYLWFESFPIVYEEMHGFNLGLSGLPYLTFIVAACVTFPVYVLYLVYHLNPRMDTSGGIAPEARLELALFAGVMIPISLFVFGWTSSPNIHWIWPTIGAGLYFPGIYLLFQCISMYITTAYPKYTASILGSNALFRSAFASAFPLFGKPYFDALGLGGGCSLLAGVSMLMIPFLWVSEALPGVL